MNTSQQIECNKIGLETASGTVLNKKRIRMILEADVDAVMGAYFEESTKAYYLGETPSGMPQDEVDLDDLAEALKDLAAQKYGLTAGKWTERALKPEIERHLRERGRDCALLQVKGLPEWDRAFKITRLARAIFGIEDEGQARAFELWMRSAAKRLLTPGGAIPGALIMRGEESELATAAIKLLFDVIRLPGGARDICLKPSAADFSKQISRAILVKFEGIRPTAGIMARLAHQAGLRSDLVRERYGRDLHEYPRRASLFSTVGKGFDLGPGVATPQDAEQLLIVDYDFKGREPRDILDAVMDLRRPVWREAVFFAQNLT